MKRGAVLYSSKYGATKQYALWLADDLKIPCLDISRLPDQSLDDYDYIILGSSVYYGKLLVRPFLTKHSALLKLKKLFIFIVCATPDTAEREQKKILKDNIPETLLREDNTFFLPGRLALGTLNLFERIMLRLVALFEKDPERKKVMTRGVDAVSKDNLIDLDIVVRAFLLSKQ